MGTLSGKGVGGSACEHSRGKMEGPAGAGLKQRRKGFTLSTM